MGIANSNFMKSTIFQNLSLLLILLFNLMNCHKVNSQSARKGIWTYKMKKGDSPNSVAKYLGINATAIEIADSTQYSSNGTPLTLNVSLPISTQRLYKEEGNFLLHRIKPNEELHQIAKQYQTSIDYLLKINYIRKNSIENLKYLLVPNTMQLKQLYIGRFLSLGYNAGNDYTGETKINYNFFGRINLRKEVIKPPFRNVTKWHSMIGYRHDIGEHFYKNIDRFEFEKQLNYSFSRLFSGFTHASMRTHHFNSYLYIAGDKKMVAGPFAPAFFHFALGPSFSGKSFNIDLALYQLKATFVKNNKLFEKQNVVYGVEKGKFFNLEQGASVRVDVYLYQGEKWNFQSNFFGFVNSLKGDGFEMDLRTDFSYRFNKYLNISFLLEAFYDPDVYDFIHFQNRFSLGISFNSRKNK